MPHSTLSPTRSLQASACALAHFLLLVFTPWLHIHPREDHGATDGHVYHLHPVVVAVAGGHSSAAYETGDDPYHTEGVALTPEDAFDHLLDIAVPQMIGPPSSARAKNRPPALAPPFPASAGGGGQPSAIASPVSFPGLNPYPEPSPPS